MAGFENVVRPVVFPNIRPTPTRSLPPADDPEKGFCVIKGNGATVVDTSYSFSMSMSRSRSVETMRRVDLARVYQETHEPAEENGDEEGTDRDNYVDIEVANKIRQREGKQGQDAGLVKDKVANYGGQKTHGDLLTDHFFRRIQPASNIEILDRDLMRDNPDDRGG